MLLAQKRAIVYIWLPDRTLSGVSATLVVEPTCQRCRTDVGISFRRNRGRHLILLYHSLTDVSECGVRVVY